MGRSVQVTWVGSQTKFQAVIIISLKTSVQYCPGIGKSNMILNRTKQYVPIR